MQQRATRQTNRADYGLDAPLLVRKLAMGGGTIALGGLVGEAVFAESRPLLAITLLLWGLSTGSSMLVTAVLLIWSSRFGKLKARDHLLAMFNWRGDEQVLDVGCGRGLLLVGAAKRLTTGRAVGVDIWAGDERTDDQPKAAWQNACHEGVAQRVEVRYGDARALPFEPGSFDVVLSGLVLHHLASPQHRAQALAEMIRVLKPGGCLAIMDHRYTDEYEAVLRQYEVSEVRRSSPVRLMLPPVRVVSATKPAGAAGDRPPARTD